MNLPYRFQPDLLPCLTISQQSGAAADPITAMLCIYLVEGVGSAAAERLTPLEPAEHPRNADPGSIPGGPEASSGSDNGALE